MRAGIALLLRGIRWRLGASLLTVLTSAVAVGAAVLGPLYLWSAGDSVVRSTLAAAPVEARGITLSPGPGIKLDRLRRAETAIERGGAGLAGIFGRPITSVISGVGLVGPGPSPIRSQMFSRTGICDALRFEQGGCDLGPGDAVISDRSARELRVSLGSVLDASVSGRPAAERLRITGIYAVPNLNLPYWWGDGSGYFPYGHAVGPDQIPEIDSLIVSQATAGAVPPQELPDLTAQMPLRAAAVGLGDAGSVEHGLTASTVAAARHGIVVSTRLPALLAGASRQRHVMSTIVVVAAVQLVLLAIWVLGSLLLRSGDARQAEIRVARLRGFPVVSMLWVTAAEPAILCLIGAVVGVAGALGAVIIARNRLLDPAATISADGWAFAALTVTGLAIAGTLAFATTRTLRTSGLEDRAAPGTAAARRTRLVADSALLVLSIVALVALGTSGALAAHNNPIAAAAPGLIALGTAVVAVQLVLFVCRVGVSASANSARVAAFLALRQIVRRPAVLRQARVLIISLCLACFATAAWSVARSNRATAARFAVGSTSVVTVIPRGVGLEQAVARVDPHGRFAMAAETVRTSGATLLAVDAPRLSATASWPQGISNATIAATGRALDPPTAPVVNLRSSRIRVSANTSASFRGGDLRDLDLALWVFNPQSGTSIVNLGPLRAGESTFDGSLTAACPGGCRLDGVAVVPAPGRPVAPPGTIRIRVSRVATRARSGAWRAAGADLIPGGWRSSAAGVLVTPARGALTLVIPAQAAVAYTGAVGSAIAPMASVADHPSVLPGAVGSALQAINAGPVTSGRVSTQGLDGNTISVRPAVSAASLPRVGSDAVMVDLGLLRRSQIAPTDPSTSDEVWLGPSAPTNALARLLAAGLEVQGVQRASVVFARMQRSGPALGYDFLLVAAIVALIVAAASTLGALGATSRQRATELTALEVGGVRRPILARSLAVESSILAVTALFGTVAGVIAAIMAIPSLPELAVPSVVPLDYAIPVLLVVAVSLAVVAVVVVTMAAGSAALMHRMSPVLLRTAPNDTTG